MAKSVPAIWQDQTVWILGSGFSIIEQFEIPYQVYAGIADCSMGLDALGIYLQHVFTDKPVVGINCSGLIGSFIDALYFRDCNFYGDYRDKIRWKFKGGLRFSSCKKQQLGSEVQVLDKGDKLKGISTKSNQVCWNYDSGGAAINLAVQLGAKRIILVGYDMKPGPNGEKRWHGEHTKTNGKIANQPYDRFLKSYGQIAKDADKLGVEIINANPWSALDQFPKANVEDL